MSQSGWRACAKCSGLAFFGTARCPAGGVHDHATSGNYTLPHSRGAPPAASQTNWRWCSKCQTLAFEDAGAAGPCAAGGVHEHAASGNYGLDFETGQTVGEHGWKWCGKCLGLFHEGTGAGVQCLAGGSHDGGQSKGYVLSLDGSPGVPGGQSRWALCAKCGMLAFDGYSNCAGGGSHVYAGSAPLEVGFESASSRGQTGWRWCSACYALVYMGGESSGACPAQNGGHTVAGSGSYVLSQKQDVSTAAAGQYLAGWKWCGQCQMTWDAGHGDAKCPLSPNSAHASDGSGDYAVQLEAGGAESNSSVGPTETPCLMESGCTPSSTPTSNNSDGLSIGSKIGIGVGVGLGVLIIAAVIVGLACCKRRRTRRQSMSVHGNGGKQGYHVGDMGVYPKYGGQRTIAVAELPGPDPPYEVGSGGMQPMQQTDLASGRNANF